MDMGINYVKNKDFYYKKDIYNTEKTEKKVGGDICHKRFSFCIRQCIKNDSVNRVVHANVNVISMQRDRKSVV